MIVYVHTSALLRIILREPGAVEDLRSYDGLVSSEIIAVESTRTIDRLRLQGSLTPEETAVRLRAINEWLEAIDLVLIRPRSATTNRRSLRAPKAKRALGEGWRGVWDFRNYLLASA